MTGEEYIAGLEARIAALEKERQTQPSYYRQAVARCRTYTKDHGFSRLGCYGCLLLTRDAFKEKKKGPRIERMYNIQNAVETAEDAELYFEMFKAFLDVWEKFMREG